MVAEKLIDLIIRNRLMDKIVSYDQIQEMVKQIRSMRNGFVTNFYWDDKKHPYWIKEGTLLYDAKPDSFLLIHTADGFANLYYIANSIDIALCHFEEIKHEFDIVVDVVSKGKSNDIIDRFKRNGFEPYKSLFRMTHSGLMLVEEWSVDKIVIPATKEDIGEIRNCLYKGFDPLAEQLPSYQELSDFIDHLFIFTSYRDPSLEKTFRAFIQSLEYTAEHGIPENILEQAVITMVGRDLKPKTPGAKALEECVRDMKGLTWELKKKRREILQKLTVRDIMESAAALESASEKAALVTIAGRQAVKKEKSFIKEKGFKITDLSI